ncbi:MAG: hypothetical protein IPP15_19320 [Saprospiraceae bacterium]|uniref:Uncharacterized protein n=1 Tax=Candidatus Opimibacter skivensis TaxID=2982028 RepID=A0A9D7SYW6_9BACT|nr:hypothetical protein [Candidatus Opimibacter skivensis]
MKKNKPNALDEFLGVLKNLSIEQLLMYYIEAKTGTEPDTGKIPVVVLEAIEALGDELDILYADQIKGKLFTEFG